MILSEPNAGTPTSSIQMNFPTFTCVRIKIRDWNLFVRLLSLTFIFYWAFLFSGLDDWISTQGFHLHTPESVSWLPLPEPFPSLIGLTGFVAAVALFIFPHSRAASLTVCSALGLATFSDWASTGAQNINFLFGFAVAATRPSLSADKSELPISPFVLIQVYLVLVYFLSGWRKAVFGNWLDDPHVLLQTMTGFYATSFQKALIDTLPSITWPVLQYGTVLFELAAPLLFFSCFRKQAVYAGLALHIGIALLMKDLCFFSAQMLVFYLPFLPSLASNPEIPKPGKDSNQDVT